MIIKPEPPTWLPEISPKGLVDVFNSKNTSLARIIKDEGIEVAQARIEYLIIDLLEFFNLVRMMTEKQVSQTAELIVECYPLYKIDDFVLCFKNIKKNDYIKLYEGIDGSKILECLEMYDQKRSDEIIEIRSKESEAHKKEKVDWSPEIIDFVKKKINVSEEKTPSIPSVRERTPGEILCDSYIRDFEDLYVKQKRDDKVVKFVIVNKKHLSLDEYINQRFKEDNYGI